MYIASVGGAYLLVPGLVGGGRGRCVACSRPYRGEGRRPVRLGRGERETGWVAWRTCFLPEGERHGACGGQGGK